MAPRAPVVSACVRGPYDLQLSLRIAASFSPDPPGHCGRLRAAVTIDSPAVVLEVRQVARSPARLEISSTGSPDLDRLRRLAEWIVLADLDLRPFYRLAARDPVLRRVTRELRGLKHLRTASVFEMAVIAVTEQQISLAAGYRIRSRLVERFGKRVGGFWAFPRADALARASLDELLACGLSHRKAECIGELARDMDAGRLDLEAVATMPDDEVRSLVTSRRGLGPWSADYILVRGLGRPDCVPVDDLGLRDAVGAYLWEGARATAAEVAAALEPFSPYRGIAAFYLLAHRRRSRWAAPGG